MSGVYRHRPNRVEALHVSELGDAALWLSAHGGQWFWQHPTDSGRHGHIIRFKSELGWDAPVLEIAVGDWLVYDGHRFEVYPPARFHQLYEQVGD